jgi:hypothetical protein
MFSGTFHFESQLTTDPFAMTMTLTERSNFQNVSGYSTVVPGRKYQVNDYQRTVTRTYPLLGPITIDDTDHQEVVSNDSSPNFLLEMTVRQIVDPSNILDPVEIDVSGPGSKCTG